MPLPKPPACAGCALHDKGVGFAPPEGPTTAPLLFVGEALGKVEASVGRPFVGDAGGMLQRLLGLLGWERAALRIANTISCFPGDSRVDADGIRRGYRRWYVGDVITVTTRDGVLTGTPNHPVLTDQGWVALGRLTRGHYLIRGTACERMPRRHPDVEDAPPTFAQVFDALTNRGRRGRVVGGVVDFHGDGCEGEVEVVAADGMLRVATDGTILQPLDQGGLSGTDQPAAGLVGAGALSLTASDLVRGWDSPVRRVVGGCNEGRTALRVEARPAHFHREAARTEADALLAQRVAQTRLTNLILDGQGLQRFPVAITLSEVVHIERTSYAGHVYNLQTTSEQYVVNGFIVHNCRPPNDWFDERAPWYWDAIHRCPYLDPVLAEPHRVIVPLGQTALKKVLGLVGHKKIRIQDFHGTVTRLPSGQLVVPTFHPSFLQRGASNLIGTVLWDLQRAEQVAREGWPDDPAQVVCDPPLDWFEAWVSTAIAARQQDRDAYPLSVDIETPDKAGGRDEGELTSEDRSFQILRVNLSCHPDEGITVPFVGPYIDQLRRLLASPGPQWYWNREYDFERLVASEVLRESQSPDCVDLMWLWHVLQSDVPRGLGFVAPFYSSFGAWKHLAGSDPVRYAAIDGFQTHRVGFGIYQHLRQTGQWSYAYRHTHVLHTRVLRPAQLIGVQTDRARLDAFNAELTEKAQAAMARIQAAVPESLQPLTPKAGLTRKPVANVLHTKASTFTKKGTPKKGRAPSAIKQELYSRATVIEKLVIKEVLTCTACGTVDVQRRHRCKDKTLTPAVGIATASVTRWFWQEPFNPDSPAQILGYLKARGHKPGVAKKTHKDTTNRETLERLARTTKDPFYSALLDYRAVMKVKGTYVEGTVRRLDPHDRLHPRPTFKPSTMRLSYVDPNITNVVADKGSSTDKPALAAGFRKCIVAGQTRPPMITDADLARWAQKYHVSVLTPAADLWKSQLVEVDFSAIEAVLTAYRAGDPEMMRLAKLGIHAALASHVLGQPYDPTWPDDQIAAYFSKLKEAHPEVYDPAKRFIHGRNYGLTRRGMMLTFPHLFPTEKVAQRYEQTFAQMAPKIPAWQRASQRLAARQRYLGGDDHPFRYRHWFWSVYGMRRISVAQYYKILAACKAEGVEAPVTEMNGQYFRVTEGEDAKRALAFFGQSTGAGVLKEALLRLFADPASPSYIGDAWFGQTPFRAPIHDSGLFEIPVCVLPQVLPIIIREFTRPVPELPLPADWGLGSHLAIGVAAKAGDDWEHMGKLKIDQWLASAASLDEDLVTPVEDEDVDDWKDLERVG